MTVATSAADSVNKLKAELGRRQLTIVVGTGVTAAATGGAAAATWKGLIHDGISRVETAGYRDNSWVARARNDVESIYPDDLVVAAEKVTTALGGVDGPEYAVWLRDTAGSLVTVHDAVPAAIAALAHKGALVVTTNYDDILTAATGWRETTWRDQVTVGRIFRGDEDGIVHVHGHWRDPRSVVFGSTSYAQVMLDDSARAFLQSLLYSRTVLYVGFGAGLDDPNFSALRRWRTAAMSSWPYPEYRLVTDVEAATAGPHPADGIVAVGYGPDHSHLAAFLQTLATGSVVAGLRGLSVVKGRTRDTQREYKTVIPLPKRRPSVHQIEQLSDLAGQLAAIQSLSEGDEFEGAAVQTAGGPLRFEQIRRFAASFADEMSQVAHVADVIDTVELPTIEQALDWASALLNIFSVAVETPGRP